MTRQTDSTTTTGPAIAGVRCTRRPDEARRAVARNGVPDTEPDPDPDPGVGLEYQPNSWQQQAACATGGGGLTHLFFSDEVHDIARAKRICEECTVVASCLESALDAGERHGVWGGQLFRSGRVVEVKRPRGRPPRVPRTDHQLPQIPVPLHLRSRLSV